MARLKHRPRTKATPPDGGKVTTRRMTDADYWAPRSRDAQLLDRSGFEVKFTRKDKG